MSIPFTPLYIDGQYRPASTAATFDVRNPYSNEIVSQASSASSEDCANAVEAAARAFPAWEQTPAAARRDYLLKVADLLVTDKYREKVMLAMQEETAANGIMQGFNVYVATIMIQEVATMICDLKGETFPSGTPGGQVIVQRRAQGVNFAIAPWNAPLVLAIRAAAYPLICGNTVVLKTSEVSPRTHQVVAEAFHEAGLPAGVLNFIHASREDTPARVAQIIAHPAVRTINFTGSDRVGKIIAGEAAKYLKPCVLELGGKAPAVVLEDADIAQAAKAITSSALLHSGQICMSTERVIVQRKVAASLTKALVEEFSKLKAGGPEEPLPAQFTEGCADNIVSMLRDARDNGAKFLLGDGTRKAAVVQPHIVTDVKPGTRLWERESFGPVTIITEVDTVDEAVEMANASEYTLVASLWTKDVHKAMDVGMRIRAGNVSINGPTLHVEVSKDHGGLGGASGYGRFNVESFTDTRSVVFHPANPPPYPLV
ncbi:uncharacterized protein FIBRA_02878 [Fibroporia radiculosa]|uniref:Aldehyde dehydrogenase domain-containing protein n=1 Tax=Fibroporia radiculosa TaxID=599839 RepID=J4I9A8_9APHY|nr:uncharacterized protein FIBRA_02878 [Fibroporia radiculosa]CCM00836.1 predicted protein [Fibroporia radiculosa]